MNVEKLIAAFRISSGDTVANPYFWSDEQVIDWLSEAQNEACVRGRLLHEDARPEVCRITLVAGQFSYALHKSLYEITHLRLQPIAGGPSRPIVLKSREWLDAEMPDWRESARPACMAIQRDTSLRLVGAFASDDVLHLEGYRLPIKDLASEADKPEIHEAHHEHLVEWALHKAFSVPDAETIDATRAAKALEEFEGYFGKRPDSDLRRSTRHDNEHRNVPIIL